jgi:hypothetical protein
MLPKKGITDRTPEPLRAKIRQKGKVASPGKTAKKTAKALPRKTASKTALALPRKPRRKPR